MKIKSNAKYSKKILNSIKKILLGLGTIGLINYAKFTNSEIKPNPEPAPWLTTITTETPPWPLLLTNNNKQQLIDWDTYISLNTYGISNLIGGLSEY